MQTIIDILAGAGLATILTLVIIGLGTIISKTGAGRY
jgi:hypothetical protein